MSIGQIIDFIKLNTLEVTTGSRSRMFGTSGILSCKPTSVTIEITNRCSLHCQMCNIWKIPTRDEIEIEEWIEIVDTLKEWLGTFKLTITGGEPFIKPGIWVFLEHCTALHLPVVVITNGYKLSTRQLQQLSKTRLAQVVISLDSLRAEIHDQIRGVSGAFEKTWETLRFLAHHSRPFLLSTNTTITEQNILELAIIAAGLDQIGVDRIFFQPVQGGFAISNDVSWPYNSKLWPSSAQRVERGMDALIEAMSCGFPVANSESEIRHFRDYLMKGPQWQRPWLCVAGYKTLFCDAFGQVRLCAPCTKTIGNMRYQSPAGIWTSEEAEGERTRMASCNRVCLLNCNKKYSTKEKLLFARKWIQTARDTRM